MKFKDIELLPGVVTNVNDPKFQGRVKATVPTLFDGTIMSDEGLPWIYPLSMIGYQGFSKLMEGSKIWVLRIKNDYKMFWYIPMFEMNANTKEILSNAYNEPDILISRSAGDESIYIYYTDADGLKMQIGNSEINIARDKTIYIKGGETAITVNNEGKITIGKNDTEFEPAILGNKLVDTLSQLASDLQQVSSVASGNVVDVIKMPMNTAGTNLANAVESLKAINTFIN